MAKENSKIKKIIKKKVIISILAPLLALILVAGVYFTIIEGIISIVKSVTTKLAEIKNDIKSFSKHPWTYFKDAVATITNNIGAFLGKKTFNPNELGIQGLDKPVIVIDTEDFEEIKNSIDTAQVNRDSAGLEDYMLKVMLLSYYRSVFLSDYNIYIQITPEEKEEIDKLNKEKDESNGKFGCPFEIIKR